MRGRGASAAIASCLLNVHKRKNGIPPGNGCVLEMVASFFLLPKANQQVEKLPIETHVICQLPSQCRKKKKWYPSRKWLCPENGCIFFLSFARQGKPRP